MIIGTSLPTLRLISRVASIPSISGIFQSRIAAKKSNPSLW